ncbi:MAG: nitroreductase family protein [Acidobacteriota bacterium]
MSLFHIDRNSCKRDGICASVCPMGLIDLKEDGYPSPIDGAEELCVKCGHCVAACPTGSLSHAEIPVELCTPVKNELKLSGEQCEQFLRARRSIRTYKEKPVPRDDLSRLIELARYAPSGHNCQCTEWLVIDTKAELKRLSDVVADWMRWMVANMPELAHAWHMDRTLKRYEEGHDVILRGAPAVVVAHAEESNRLAPSTCTIALTYLEVAATGMGLGCCWAGYFNAAANAFPAMKEALALPKGHQCFGAMMVGHPRYAYHRMPTRKAPAITWR